MQQGATKSTALPLMEAFRTVQGEGAHTGRPSFFLRIGGCDVGCHWCDVKESWDATKHPLTALEDLLTLPGPNDRTVVVTGGEPLMWDMGPLTEGLRSQGIKVHLETSGAYPLSGTWDWVCLSPKKSKAPLPEWYALADELKVIIYNEHDFAWAEQHAARCPSSTERFLQPEWSRREVNLTKIISYLELNPMWRLGLQTHKYIGMP